MKSNTHPARPAPIPATHAAILPEVTASPILKPGDRFIKIKAVQEKTSRGKSQIYADPTFPRPIKLSARESAWLESEIDNWMAEKIKAARGKAA